MMSSKPKRSGPGVTYDRIISFMRDHKELCVTAGEVAEEFDITSQAASWRLDKLKQKGDVNDKVAGSSAKVWYLRG